MSKLVDERIVEMSFDNKDFDSRVKDSLSTIDKLKDRLDFSKSADTISRSFDSIDTSTLAASLDKAGENFNVLEKVATMAIYNITNRVVDLGIEMTKSLSVDNVAAGWNKFEESTKSIGTLISQWDENMGTYEDYVKDVNSQMDKLLWYTDQTSYSYTDMVSNIGKFTASGQSLSDSVEAMMGIANWAAVSGQNAQTASRAMYQLSQAMSAGVVKLQDWRSIQNTNMDTAEFRQKALDTAVALGYLKEVAEGYIATEKALSADGKKEAFTKEQFTTQLSSGWFTSEVLTETLKEYSSAVDDIYEMMQNESDVYKTADAAIKQYEQQLKDGAEGYSEFGLKALKAAQEARTFTDAINAIKDAVSSGWMNTFTTIFGQYNDAKALWSEFANKLYDIFAVGGDLRNDILSFWSDLGGREDLFGEGGALWNLMDFLITLKETVSSVAAEVFGFGGNVEDSARTIKNITSSIKNFTANLLLSEETLNDIKGIIRGVFSIFTIGIKIFNGLKIAIQPILDILGPASGGLIKILGNAGNAFADFVEGLTIFDTIGRNIASALRYIINGITNFVKEIRSNEEVQKSFKNIITGLVDAFNLLKLGISKVVKFISSYIIPVILSLGKVISAVAITVSAYFLKFIELVSLGFSKLSKWIRENQAFRVAIDKITAFFETIPERIRKGTPIFKQLGIFFSNLGSLLLKVINSFFEFAKGINTFVIKVTGSSILGLLKKFASGLLNVFVQIKYAIFGFDTLNPKPVSNFAKKLSKVFEPFRALLKGLKDLFMGVWNLISALLPFVGKIASIIGTLLTDLSNKINELFGGDAKSILSLLVKGGFTALIVAGIIKLKNFFKLFNLTLGDILKSAETFIFSKVLINYAEAVRSFAISTLLLIAAILILAAIDPKMLEQGMKTLVAVMGVTLGMVALAVKFVNQTNSISISLEKSKPQFVRTTSAIGEIGYLLGKLGLTMLSIAVSMWIISKLPPDAVNKTLLTMMSLTGVITALALLSRKLSEEQIAAIGKLEKLISKFGKSMVLLAISLRIFNGVDWQSVGKAAASIGAMGLIFVTVLGFMVKIQKGSKKRGGVMPDTIERYVNQISKVLKKMAVSMAALAASILLFNFMSWQDFAKASASLGMAGAMFIAILGFMVLIQKGIGKQGGVTPDTIERYVKQISKIMIKLAKSLGALAAAIAAFGAISWSSIMKATYSLGAVAFIYVAVLAFMRMIQKGIDKEMGGIQPSTLERYSNSLSKTFASLAGSMAVLAASMLMFGAVNWQAVLKATTALGLVSTIYIAVIGFMALLQKAFAKTEGFDSKSFIKYSKALSISLISMSAALFVMTKAIAQYQYIDWNAIWKGLTVFGIALSALVVSIAILSKLGPNVMFVGGMFLEIGASVLLAATGVYIFAAALGLLAENMDLLANSNWQEGSKAIGEIVKAMTTGIIQGIAGAFNELMAMFTSLLIMLPSIASKLFSSLITVLGESSSMISTALVTVLTESLVSLAENAGTIIDAIITIVLLLLDKLIENRMRIMDKLITLLLGLIDSLTQNIGRIMSTLSKFWLSFIESCVQCIIDGLPRLINAAYDLIVGLIDGLGQAIEDNAGRITEALERLLIHISNAFKKLFGIHSPSTVFFQFGANIFQGLINGMTKMLSSVVKIFPELWKSIWNNVKTWSKSFLDIGKNIMEGLKKGIKDTASKVWDGIKDVGNSIKNGFCKLFGINSPSRVFAEYGEFIDMGLANGLNDASNKVYNAMQNVSDEVIDGFDGDSITKAMSNLTDSLNDEIGDDLVIRPVMDLSDVQNGTNQIYSMMKDIDGYSVSGSNNYASRAARDIYTSKNAQSNSNEVVTPAETNNEYITNTFNINGTNAKEIADEVVDRISQQIDRRKTRWAL